MILPVQASARQKARLSETAPVGANFPAASSVRTTEQVQVYRTLSLFKLLGAVPV